MNTTRAIIFDLDETLINRHETMRLFLTEQHQRFTELKHCDATTFAATCLKFQENGYANKLDAFTKACIFLEIPDAKLPKALFADFKTHYGKKVAAFDGAEDLIRALQQDFTLGLVTNGRTVGQMAKLESVGLTSFFSAILISESHGTKKPDHSIFIACLEALGVTAQEAIFIGDNPSADIKPAEELGMFTVWMRNDNFEEPSNCDAVADDVKDLPEIIVRICEAQNR
jgi:putative hydrolase of the HAD superfamily